MIGSDLPPPAEPSGRPSLATQERQQLEEMRASNDELKRMRQERERELDALRKENSSLKDTLLRQKSLV
jgi:hypothetical protein